MTAFRTLSGAVLPPYYSSHVLPTYIRIIGIETLGQQPSGPVISYNGWRQFLIQKILSNPDEQFMHYPRAAMALGVQLPQPLTRSDFPPMPSAAAMAKEQQFKTQIYAMAQGRLAGGVVVGGHSMAGGHAAGGHQGGGDGKLAASAVHGLAKIALNGGVNLFTGGMGGTGQPFFQ